MAKELKELSSVKAARSCRDVQLEKPDTSSGAFTVDPNLGSSMDSVKAYCHFEDKQATTCVQNSTSFSQLNNLHLLHTHASQTIQLPCSVKGPLRCVCVCVCLRHIGRCTRTYSMYMYVCMYRSCELFVVLNHSIKSFFPSASLPLIVIMLSMCLSQRREVWMLPYLTATQ